MMEDMVDVYYPAGDTFSRDTTDQAGKDKLHAIGYLTDQSEKQVNQLYQRIAENFNEEKLGGKFYHWIFMMIISGKLLCG